MSLKQLKSIFLMVMSRLVNIIRQSSLALVGPTRMKGKEIENNENS